MAIVLVAGGGAGGAAAAVELVNAGHDVRFWTRSGRTLDAFVQQGGIGYKGILGDGLATPQMMTTDLAAGLDGATVVLICLPTFAHADLAGTLAHAGCRVPIVLNPGHTGGALEVRHVMRQLGVALPPIAELSTLTYVARKPSDGTVNITGRAREVKVAALPGGASAIGAATELFPACRAVGDVLATDLANVNMVLHPPGAILGAAWVEATKGDFTFYVQAMTPGVARVMAALDGERLAVARAFGHELPSLVDEMRAIGTVEGIDDGSDLAAAISGGRANQTIKAPSSLGHRYYLEDFGHGLLPFTELAAIAGVEVPVAQSLLTLAETLLGIDFRANGRTAQRMGLAGLSRAQTLDLVGARR